MHIFVLDRQDQSVTGVLDYEESELNSNISSIWNVGAIKKFIFTIHKIK